MLAVRLNIETRSLTVEDVPTPEAQSGQVRIRVAAAGVCLSDVHLIDGSLRPRYLSGASVTLGHEVAGVIDQVGPEVTGLREGQRVLLHAGETVRGRVLTRGVDYDGGWAEYAVASKSTVTPIPDTLPLEQAAILPDAVSTPWAAISTTARVRPAEPVGVWGAGGLGAHAIQLLRLAGAAPIIAIDPLAAARDRALQFGADRAIDPTDPDLVATVRDATGGHGLAVAFDFAGVAAVREQAAACLGLRGRLVLVGLTNQPLTITNGTAFSYFQQQVLGHYGSEPAHLLELINLVRYQRVNFARSISQVLPLHQAHEAVGRLIRKEGSPIRLVLRP